MKVLSNLIIELGGDFFDHVDLAVQLVESDAAIFERKKRVVAAHADVGAGMKASAALADDDVARDDDFAAEFLNAEALGIAVASVA